MAFLPPCLQSMRRSQVLFVVLALALLPLGIYIIWGNGSNADIWHVMNTGRLILEKGFVHEEPFTMHEGLSYMPQQWLSGVIFYAVYVAAGSVGLSCFVYGIVVLSAWIAIRVGCLRGGGRFTVGHVAAAGLSIVLVVSICGLRPRVFDLLVFLCVVYLLRRAELRGAMRALALIPILTCVFVNLHASIWPVVFMAGASFFLAALIKRDWRFAFFLALTGTASFVALFLNPYGVDAVLYIFRSLSPLITNSITECLPLHRYAAVVVSAGNDTLLILALVIFLVIAFGLALSIRLVKSQDLSFPFLWLVFSAFSFYSFRNAYFLVGVVLVMLSQRMFLHVEPDSDRVRMGGESRRLERLLLLALLTIFAAGCSCLPTMMSTEMHGDASSGAFIVQDAAERLEKDVSALSVYVDDGSYLEFVYRLPCYYDARAEVFLKSLNGCSEIRGEFLEMANSSDVSQWSRFVEKYGFDYMVLRVDQKGHMAPSDECAMKAARNAGYKEVFRDDCRIVLAL